MRPVHIAERKEEQMKQSARYSTVAAAIAITLSFPLAGMSVGAYAEGTPDSPAATVQPAPDAFQVDIPSTVLVKDGDKLTITATAEGAEKFTWAKGNKDAKTWTDLEAKDSSGQSVYSKEKASADDSAAYRVIVTKGEQQVEKTLLVHVIPSSVAVDGETTVAEGAKVTLSASALSVAGVNPEYTWEYSSTQVGDYQPTQAPVTINGNTLSIESATADQSGFYRAVAIYRFDDATPDHLAVTSKPVELTVKKSDATAPSITTQPANTTVEKGKDATFSVVVDGASSTSLSYEWWMSKADDSDARKIEGNETASTAQLKVDAVANDMDGWKFWVVITDDQGKQLTSEKAVLSLAGSDNQPGDTPSTPSASADSSSDSSAGSEEEKPAPSESSANESASSTSPSASKPAPDSTDDTAQSGPRIADDGQPLDATVLEGQPASFSVTMADEGDYTYQWHSQYKGATLSIDPSNTPSAVTADLTVANPTVDMDGMVYWVEITDANGHTTTSAKATLHVNAAPDVKILTDPVDVTAPIGGQATFTVEAQGKGLTYQWWWRSSATGLDEAQIDNPTAKSDSLTLENISADWDGREIWVVVTNADGDFVVSSVARLHIGEVREATPASSTDKAKTSPASSKPNGLPKTGESAPANSTAAILVALAAAGSILNRRRD